jgi:hypothetical protein
LRVFRVVPSENGNLVEVVHAAGIPFIAVAFVIGRGMRVPDNGYRYRKGVPIEEYFQNWGRVLDQMHALVKNYQPLSEVIKRPVWFIWEYFIGFSAASSTIPIAPLATLQLSSTETIAA